MSRILAGSLILDVTAIITLDYHHDVVTSPMTPWTTWRVGRRPMPRCRTEAGWRGRCSRGRRRAGTAGRRRVGSRNPGERSSRRPESSSGWPETPGPPRPPHTSPPGGQGCACRGWGQTTWTTWAEKSVAVRSIPRQVDYDCREKFYSTGVRTSERLLSQEQRDYILLVTGTRWLPGQWPVQTI